MKEDAKWRIVCTDCENQANKRNNLQVTCNVPTQQKNQVNPVSVSSKDTEEFSVCKTPYGRSPSGKEDSKEQIVHTCDECGKELKKKKGMRGQKSAGHHSCVHSGEATQRRQI